MDPNVLLTFEYKNNVIFQSKARDKIKKAKRRLSPFEDSKINPGMVKER